MPSRRAFKSQKLGFYFSINGLKAGAGTREREEADAIHNRANRLLAMALPRMAEWGNGDAGPYELCDKTTNLDRINGFAAFSYWLCSHKPISPEAITKFREVVEKGYSLAARALGGEATFIRMESVTRETPTHGSKEGMHKPVTDGHVRLSHEQVQYLAQCEVPSWQEIDAMVSKLTKKQRRALRALSVAIQTACDDDGSTHHDEGPRHRLH